MVPCSMEQIVEEGRPHQHGTLAAAEGERRALRAAQGTSGERATHGPSPCMAPALAIAQGAAAHGPITVLVNNAAHDERHAFDTVTPEYWDDRMAVNLRHQFFAAQAVHPMMKAAGGGSIVNFGSVSWMIGQGGMPGYTAAKSAIMGLTRGLARDFGGDNIRVNSIAPGWIMTERQISLWLDEEGERELMKRQCLKRKLYPDDMARIVLFLAADDSSAMTNQTYVADGGWV